jgi:hypothetical protein
MITKSMKLQEFDLTDQDIELLNSIKYSENEARFLRDTIRKYLANGYPIDVLVKNYQQIRELGSDSSSLNSHIIRYGEELGTKMYHEKNSKTAGASLENFQRRHGEKRGLQKWNEYLLKRAKTYEQGRKENRYQSRNEEWFINRYGEKVGKKKWNAFLEKCSYQSSRQYWIDQYGEEEGMRLCKENKTRSLENFVTKYGEVEGEKRYNEWLKKIAKSLRTRNSYSKWSKECCDAVKEYIPDLHFYAENEIIWQLPAEFQEKLGQKIISPDLFYRGKVIEFNGDVHHGNPRLFESHETPHPHRRHLTVEDLNNIDQIRYEYYIYKGYSVLEIWENDYKKQPYEIIQLCVQFLK